MANPLRKTMVYLGLADEEFDYDESAPATSAAGARHPVGSHQNAGMSQASAGRAHWASVTK